MTTVKAFIRTSKRNKEKTVAVRFRLSDGRNIQLFHKSEIMVNSELWDAQKECIKAKTLYNRIERINFARSVVDRKNLMLELYSSIDHANGVTSQEFEKLIQNALHPKKVEVKEEVKEKPNFYRYFVHFLEVKDYLPSDRKNFMTMMRLLQRFELYIGIKYKRAYKLEFDNMDVELIRELEYFIRNEYLYVDKPVYKLIYEELPEKRRPELRGDNTVVKVMKRFRTFIKWSIKEKLIANDPFIGYEMKSPQYGTPYFITIEERTKIAEENLLNAWETLPDEKRKTIHKSFIPQLEIQRDIFVFHCMIGCRVGDLVQFTTRNVIDGHISYIARKTRKERVNSIEVPLNQTAMDIIEKYKAYQQETGKLLPFLSPQKYNDCIKMIFLLCGITRCVTIWNSTLGIEEQRPLNELASSHLARRTFIGNLYKKVQDPNLIGKLSGHVEGSKAFSRYRDIDDEMKRKLVDMLE